MDRMRTLLHKLGIADGSDATRAQPPPVQVDTASVVDIGGEWQSVEEHADQLIALLVRSGCTRGSLLSADLQHVHRQMCFRLRWLQRPWSPIAKCLRERSGGRKTYAWLDGRRRRIFSLQKLTSAPTSAVPGKRDLGHSVGGRVAGPEPLHTAKSR